MDTTYKLIPGQQLIPLPCPQLLRSGCGVGAPDGWQTLFVIRGQHRPFCKTDFGAPRFVIDKNYPTRGTQK